MLIFLKLYLAHLLSDFLLQPDSIARHKDRLSVLSRHALIHFATACLVVNVNLTVSVMIVILAVTVIHATADYIKARFLRDDWLTFALDQIGHLVVVAVAALWLSDGWSPACAVIQSALQSKSLYLYACAYALIVLGGGYFVQRSPPSSWDKSILRLYRRNPGSVMRASM